VNPALGSYGPFPVTLTPVPTVVPPVEQSDGAKDCGPNTLNVTVPVGDAPPDNEAETDEAAIVEFAVPPAGADADSAGVVFPLTTVLAIENPHVETAGAFSESPP
jgi:hypothetical protein